MNSAETLSSDSDTTFTWKCIICIVIVLMLTILEALCAYHDVRKACPVRPREHTPVNVYHLLGDKSI